MFLYYVVTYSHQQRKKQQHTIMSRSFVDACKKSSAAAGSSAPAKQPGRQTSLVARAPPLICDAAAFPPLSSSAGSASVSAEFIAEAIKHPNTFRHIPGVEFSDFVSPMYAEVVTEDLWQHLVMDQKNAFAIAAASNTAHKHPKNPDVAVKPRNRRTHGSSLRQHLEIGFRRREV